MADENGFAVSSSSTSSWSLYPVATFPRLRALLWADSLLYASRGYNLLRAEIGAKPIEWEPAAYYKPQWWRNVSSSLRLTSRLSRDGFHALAKLSSGHLVGAVPGAIVTLNPDERVFRISHRILRGTRPLHIAATPGGHLYWGEYFDNPVRDGYTFTPQPTAVAHGMWHTRFPRGRFGMFTILFMTHGSDACGFSPEMMARSAESCARLRP